MRIIQSYLALMNIVEIFEIGIQNSKKNYFQNWREYYVIKWH